MYCLHLWGWRVRQARNIWAEFCLNTWGEVNIMTHELSYIFIIQMPQFQTHICHLYKYVKITMAWELHNINTVDKKYTAINHHQFYIYMSTEIYISWHSHNKIFKLGPRCIICTRKHFHKITVIDNWQLFSFRV